jgi:hypothetical protein
VKFRGRLGPTDQDDKEIRILNRIITWTEEGILYEADQRHAEIIIREMNLKSDSKTAVTPFEKTLGVEDDPLVESAEATQYRGIVARGNYLAQDRTDLGYAVKELSKEMSSPRREGWGKLKRLARCLKGRPRLVMRFDYQSEVKGVTVWTDTDFAGCVKSRKSTSAGLIQLGGHLMKSWSTNQAVIALSSGEAEYYGLVKGASMGLGAASIIRDLGWDYEDALEIRTDASAAIGIANRIGIGKIRHIETNQLWLQQKVLEGKLVVSKVKGEDNLADALTKPVDGKLLTEHLVRVGSILPEGRHALAPVLDATDDEVAQGEGALEV